MRRIIIPLHEDRGSEPHLYINARSRRAGATGVQFIDHRQLVINSLRGKRLYLVTYDWEHGTHQIVSNASTKFATDLLDFDGNASFLTSNCAAPSAVSLYYLTDGSLRHTGDVRIRHKGVGSCHGARFVPGTDLLCAACTTEACAVFFFTRQGKVLHSFTLKGWRPKDIYFVDCERMLVLSSQGKPLDISHAGYKSKLSLYRFDLRWARPKLLSELTFEGHMDGCVHHAGRIFSNNQTRDTIIQCQLVGDSVKFERELTGYNFPHGVDVLPRDDGDLLAVTNYGDNTVEIRQLERTC